MLAQPIGYYSDSWLQGHRASYMVNCMYVLYATICL